MKQETRNVAKQINAIISAIGKACEDAVIARTQLFFKIGDYLIALSKIVTPRVITVTRPTNSYSKPLTPQGEAIRQMQEYIAAHPKEADKWDLPKDANYWYYSFRAAQDIPLPVRNRLIQSKISYARIIRLVLLGDVGRQHLDKFMKTGNLDSFWKLYWKRNNTTHMANSKRLATKTKIRVNGADVFDDRTITVALQDSHREYSADLALSALLGVMSRIPVTILEEIWPDVKHRTERRLNIERRMKIPA